MPNGMDYSLKNRVIDGTGMILDTEPGTPDDVGTYVTENQLADWIKGKILFTGYYHNGNFYSDSGHTTLLAKVNGALYIDQTNANKALYTCLSSTYQSLTEEAQVQAILDGLADGTIVPLKAKQDQNGNVIDTTYATKAELAAEESARESEDSNLKDAIDKNSNRISNLEQEHGGYVTVNYRGTNNVPTGKAKYGLVESIVGKSRAWNQLASPTSGTDNDITFSESNGKISFSGTSQSNFAKFRGLYNFATSLVVGHKYAVFASGDASYVQLREYTTSNTYTSKNLNEILTVDSNFSYLELRLNGIYNISLNGSVTFVVRDLTLIFPEGVPSTVAECVAKCPDILKYDAYGTSMVDTTVEGVESIGFNLLTDGNVELGTYDANGAEYPSSTGNWWRTADFVDVKPCMTYYAKIAKNYTTSNANIYAYFYDENGSFISRAVNIGNTTFETPPNCYKINLNYYFVTATLQTPTEMCLNISGSEDGTYKPYRGPVTLSLPSPVTLRSAGDVADTDELNVEVLVDGVKVNKRRQTKRIGTYTFTGNEVWENSGANAKSCNVISSIVKSLGAGNINNILFPTLITNTFNNIYNGTVTGAIGLSTAGLLAISNSDYSNRETLITGKTINFELATESVTLLDPIINNTIRTEGGGTIETIQTQTTVIDNSMDVGYLAL